MSEVLGPVAAMVLAMLAVGYFAQSRLPPPKPVIVGIDLGTTFSCVGVYNAISGDVSVLDDESGSKLVPSAVYFGKQSPVVGYSALDYRELYPDLVIYDAKRFIGKRSIKRSSIERQQRLYPFKIQLDSEGRAGFAVVVKDNVSHYQPEDIGALILAKLKQTAERLIERKLTMAVISVPAEFDSLQRNSTIEAGRRAGLKVIRVINEPTAAALAYGLHKREGISYVMVVDFGGGTFDVSLLNIQGGMFYTMAMAGNNRLGGQDINQNLVAYLVNAVTKGSGIEALDGLHLQHIRTEVENIKISLSNSEFVDVNMTFKSLTKDNTDFNFSHRITRAVFEQINQDVFRKILIPIKRVLKEVEMNEDEIDEIVLVGGSTRIPKVRQIIHQFFGKKPNVAVDPELAVVSGVAIQAGILGGMWPLRVAAVELPTSNIQKIEVGEEL